MPVKASLKNDHWLKGEFAAVAYQPLHNCLAALKMCCLVVTFSFVVHFFLTAPLMPRNKISSSESISFQCPQLQSSMLYYGQVSEADTKELLPPFPCEIDSCLCNAVGLKPNTGYFVALKACILAAPDVCSSDSQTKQIYTKPERKLPCSVFKKLATDRRR